MSASRLEDEQARDLRDSACLEPQTHAAQHRVAFVSDEEQPPGRSQVPDRRLADGQLDLVLGRLAPVVTADDVVEIRAQNSTSLCGVGRDWLNDRLFERPAQLDFLPPLRPAACFWARLPPLPLPLLFLLWLLLWPDPERLPPLLEASGVFAIAAARDLLMPFLRSPSYCLSSLTLGP